MEENKELKKHDHDEKRSEIDKKPRVHDKNKAELKKKIERDLTPVRGIFRCEEERGGSLTFHFKKYKEVPLQRYTFNDGEAYTVPLMVAEHLAHNCWYPIHQYQVDKDGRSTQIIGKKVKKYDFISSDFITPDQNFKRLVTVEKVSNNL